MNIDYFNELPGAPGMYVVKTPATRDHALRKAVLEALRLYDRWQGSGNYDSSSNKLQAAMDALREELAK